MSKPSIHGLLVLDKPAGITSRDAVDRALKWFPNGTRMGHTGTLDPLATGVLVLCLGNATRLTTYVQDMAKTYQAGLLLGVRSDTDDADGQITAVPGARVPTLESIRLCLRDFVGSLEQVPPQFSAAKVTGQRAYDLARQGKEVNLQPRRVQIYQIEILRFTPPLLELEVKCGKGTYIRSLARDLGERLGCGGLVQTLRRSRVGPFTAEMAVPLTTPAEMARTRVLPALQALTDLPQVVLELAEVQRLRQGQGVALAHSADLGQKEAEVAVLDRRGQLVGIGRWHPDRQLLRPEKVWQE